jgi:thymidylate synthase
MNNIDRQYKELLEHILHFGVDKKDRTGTGTKSIFGWQIRHNMKEGFPLLTTKKMAWKTMVTELLWFLRGDTNIKFLQDNNCNIWDGDYIKSGRTDGELGPIYGHQWRNWGGWKEVKFTDVRDENGYLKPTYIEHSGIDQIQNLINELKTNPDSRRLMVNAWNVSDLGKMTLPPCHYGFQVYTRPTTRDEKIVNPGKYRAISLMWNQRSVDTFLGLPFNIASYGLLLEIIAKEVNMVPDELIGNLGDVHLYSNHIEQAKEQITRTPYELPTVEITERNWYMHEAVKEHLGEKTFNEKIFSFRPDCFELINYQSHPKIKAPLSN